MELVATAMLVLGAAAAAWSDVRSRRVSNRMNAAILIAGLGWRVVAGASVLDGLAGVGVGLAMLIVPFAARWIGGGDVKLVAALGAWLGVEGVMWCCLVGVAGGGVLSAAMAVRGGVGREVAGNVGRAVVTMTGPVAPVRARRLVVPMAVPFAVAGVGVWFFAGGF